ncbi:MAG: hypothetical protein GWM90_29690 [Gemmatimonadetes bacterium]|nr:hypothetical protein [Gemmatimonadota bacterium]NIQ59262.1 hypothetical protein [Gemmatimonadota bacterium]NIU79445.1 hypothetical protein [Gammaproteobacteria bacterium]NIX48093.1 hypothetical protein [Gemmatimonadota bacterium]NIY12476.1 hypothetical protein [Gemmatimonadota bacterium]
MNTTDPRADGMGTGKLIAVMLLFVVVGAPLVYYLWTTINELLAGHFDGPRLGVSAVVLLIFLGLLSILTRSIRRWEERLN